MSSVPIPPEGPECEWKEILPRLDRVARTLAAFANGVGGRLWVGITDDGLRVGVADAKQVIADLRSAGGLCEPQPVLNLRRHRDEGLLLVEARVKPTRPGPVGVLVDGARRVYVRDGSTTRPAEEEALHRMRRKDWPSRARLDKRAARVLNLLQTSGPLDQGEVASFASMSRQAAKRILVELVQADLAQEVQGRRYSLTPSGHRKGKGLSRRGNG
jgi:predicted HTH transcriptional regulator